MTTTLRGPGMRPKSGGNPKQLVVFLHGLGADGEELIETIRGVGYKISSRATSP